MSLPELSVLLVEDDAKLASAVTRLLEYEKCAVDLAANGRDALAMARDAVSPYDVLILDWMLPEINGLDLCRILREKLAYQGGIIFLTAKNDLDDCVRALDAGADDFIAKPFEIKELIARVNAVCRRKAKPFLDDAFEQNGFRIDRALRTVSNGGTELRLRKKEFALFETLFLNLNTVLPRGVLFEKVWFDKPDTNMESLDSHIYMLRKSLQVFPKIRINLVKNIGYEMEIDS